MASISFSKVPFNGVSESDELSFQDDRGKKAVGLVGKTGLGSLRMRWTVHLEVRTSHMAK